MLFVGLSHVPRLGRLFKMLGNTTLFLHFKLLCCIIFHTQSAVLNHVCTCQTTLIQKELDSLQSRWEQHLPNLSKSQQIIANYLLASYDEAAFLSATGLAQRIEISVATVVRFAKAIG